MKLRFKNDAPDREATLLCLACGRVTPLAEPAVQPALARLAESAAHRTLYTVVSIFGFCEPCERQEGMSR